MRKACVGANETKKRAFTKNHAKAILFIVFGLEPPKNAKKGDLLTLLEKEAAENPDKIRGAVEAAQVEISAVGDAVTEDAITEVVPDSPMRVVQRAAATEDDGVGVESTVVAGGRASTMASWLYYRCVGAVTTMKSDLSPLELGKIILTTLRKIENHEDYDSDERDLNDTSNTIVFFNAFGGSVDGKKVARARDNQFIFELTEKVADPLDDYGLTEEALSHCSIA